MRRVFCSWVVTFLVLCSSGFALELEGKVASQALARLGVAEYQVASQADSTTEIALIGSNGSSIGRITVEGEWELGVIADLRSAEDALLRLVWDPNRAILQITDLSSGVTGTSRFDLQSRTWQASEDFERLASVKPDQISLLSAVLSDLEKQVRAGDKTELLSRQCAVGAPTVVAKQLFGDASILCSGPRCRGTALGFARSLCCEKAKERANLCCWNGACTGCCGWLSCDAVCGIGDYGCSCGITGTACNDPYIF